MKLNRFRSSLSTAQWGNRMWSGIAIVMVISNALLVSHIVTHNTREKTIIVPPDIKRPFSIQGDNASPEYLTQVGEWFASLALSYTPKNLDYRIEVFLRYATPESYSTLQTHLQDEAVRIKRNEMSAMFFPMDARVRGDFVVVMGQQILRVGKEIVTDKSIAYRMRFRLTDGFLHIIEFKEVNREKPFAVDNATASAR